MVVTLQSKCYMVLIFFHFLDNTSSMSANTGRRATKLRSEIISNAQDYSALGWPKGIVSYYLDNNSYDYIIAQRVRMAMNKLETVSCVKFKPALVKPSGNKNWIHFTNPQDKRDCVHEPKFKQNGEIMVIIGFDCLKEHEILHTLLHAIGFKDEVTHPQRDQYIRVMWNNIQPEYRHLYRIQSSNDKTSEFLVEYDPLSIMHFHDRAFSMNGQATVMPLVSGLLISPSDDLSQLDKMRLRLLFDHECNKRKVGDMIDSCKLILSNHKKYKNCKTTTSSNYETITNENELIDTTDVPNEYEIVDTTNVPNEYDIGDANNKPKEYDTADPIDKPMEYDTADPIDKPKEYDIADTIDKPNEKDIIDTINGPVKVDEVENGNKINKNQEIDEEGNQLHVESIENQYDLNELHPDTALNRQIPEKLMGENYDGDNDDEYDEEVENDEHNVRIIKSAEKKDHFNLNQAYTPVKMVGHKSRRKSF